MYVLNIDILNYNFKLLEKLKYTYSRSFTEIQYILIPIDLFRGRHLHV